MKCFYAVQKFQIDFQFEFYIMYSLSKHNLLKIQLLEEKCSFYVHSYPSPPQYSSAHLVCCILSFVNLNVMGWEQLNVVSS